MPILAKLAEALALSSVQERLAKIGFHFVPLLLDRRVPEIS